MRLILSGVVVACLLVSRTASAGFVDVSPSYFNPWDTISLNWSVSPNIYCDVISYEVTIIGSDGYLYSETGEEPPAGYDTDWSAPTHTRVPIEYFMYVDELLGDGECSVDSDSGSGGTDPAPPIPYILFIDNQHDIPSWASCPYEGCESGVTRWMTERIYQIIDQWGSAYHYRTWVTEDVGLDNATGACTDETTNLTTGAQWSSDDGKITDDFTICAAVCCVSPSNSCEMDLTQVIGLNGTVANINYLAVTCSGITFS